MVTFIIIISILIIFIVLGLSIFAISSGYAYKHTVDEVDQDHLEKLEQLSKQKKEEQH